ncbi:hypothetical protein CABS01_04092 [Colletotrichum abscissum]|uniref:uncharacterized protein n=1 Tax=Colletotrichum abscissum TaxID=1671311 RepID=UPI0027D763E3|nr:uncharacterized protein CABS01_04092 [Colletotrichum abscissum]KAK1473430.1 hypothetical protein CABS01_04092 [Colletotrichum abscissum]
MAKSAKIFSNEENGVNMADTPRLSTTEDENAGLLHSREPCDDGRSTRATSRLPRSQLIILTLSLSNAISIAAVLILVVFRGPAFYVSEAPATVIYPAQPEWFPPQIPVKKVLHGNKLYGQPPNPESIEAWNRLLPIGRGWVTVKNETALPDLPGLNQSLPEHRAYPSVFHQLHCLYSTMDAYYELIDRLNKNEGAKRELPTDPGWNSEHLNHCWDYLRQTIMCNADVTLEWRKYNEQVGTGWGYQHQCKDWDAIIAWAEKYRYSNNWGILRGGGERIPLQ